MRVLFIIISLAFAFTSCKTDHKQSEQSNNSTSVSYKDALDKINNNQNKSSIHQVRVLEVINSGSYTYVRLKDGNKEIWAAISAQIIEAGKTYYYKDAFEMKDFQSKSLNRVFESIWFINNFYSSNPMNNPSTNTQNSTSNSGAKTPEIETPEGAYNLAYIFEHKGELKNQEIIVRGQIMKINLNIMKTNWVHIQDGTSYHGNFDLTITTHDAINFAIDDVISFKGKLILNKDFGAGYQYDYLLEDAIIVQ
jgi:hypothetical protein